MAKIALSVICYNNETEILEFAQKLSRQKFHEEITLLVTCNSCKNPVGLQNRLKKIKENTYVYTPEKNIGYLPGCLYGLSCYTESYSWAIASNTDIDFVTDDFFEMFLETKYTEDVVCVGPDVMLATTGMHQNPFAQSRPSRRIMRFRRWIFSNYGRFVLYNWLSLVKKKLIRTSEGHAQSGLVYGVHGSFIILRKQCISDLIIDKTPIFMYGEELYIAEKLREKNLLTYYDAQLKIIHNENQTTGKVNDRRKQKWFKQSVNFLVKKYW